MSQIDLLPCPFCGEAVEAHDYTNKPVAAWVMIHRCKAIGPVKLESFTGEGLAAQWNRRAPGWQGMEITPSAPMPVLFFYGRMTALVGEQWVPMADIPPAYREERVSAGFWDGSGWCENGTSHDVMEDWRWPDHVPTRWMPLPPVPAPAAPEDQQ